MQLYKRLLLARFLRHAALVVAAVAALLLAVRLIWGWEATARLAAARAKLRAARVPLDLASFAHDPLPDNRNGALLLLQAFHAKRLAQFPPGFRGRGPGRGFFYGRMFWAFDRHRTEALLAANQQTLSLLQQASRMPQARWSVEPPAGGGAPPFEPEDDFYVDLSDMRWLLRAAAESAHHDHHDAEAFADVEEMLRLARLVEAYPSLTAQMIADSMRSEAAITVERWMPDLTFSGEQALPLRRLVTALLTSAPAPESMARAFEYETIAFPATGQQALPKLSDWWIRPLFTDAVARRFDAQVALLPIAQCRNWQDVTKVPLPHDAERNNLTTIVFTLSKPQLDVVDAMHTRFRAQTDADAIAVLLAANLQRAQAGAYPSTLNQLAPQYFASAPMDAFASDGRPLRYRLDKNGPTVWSVGEDGKDDNALLALGSTPGSPAPGSAIPARIGGRRSRVGASPLGGRPLGPWLRGRGGLGMWRYPQPDIVYGAAWRDAMEAMTRP